MKKLLFLMLLVSAFIACGEKPKASISAPIEKYVINIDTIVKDGETHYYLLCEEHNEWDEILIEDTTIIYKNIRVCGGNYLICPLSLNEVNVK